MAHRRDRMPISPLAHASTMRLLMLARLPHGPVQPRRAAAQENAGADPPSEGGVAHARRDPAGQPRQTVQTTRPRWSVTVTVTVLARQQCPLRSPCVPGRACARGYAYAESGRFYSMATDLFECSF